MGLLYQMMWGLVRNSYRGDPFYVGGIYHFQQLPHFLQCLWCWINICYSRFSLWSTWHIRCCRCHKWWEGTWCLIDSIFFSHYCILCSFSSYFLDYFSLFMSIDFFTKTIFIFCTILVNVATPPLVPSTISHKWFLAWVIDIPQVLLHNLQ